MNVKMNSKGNEKDENRCFEGGTKGGDTTPVPIGDRGRNCNTLAGEKKRGGLE